MPCLRSFIGVCGFIMEGRELQEAFFELYGENSVENFLKGHAFARAVRGDILMHLSLCLMILCSFTMKP